jgi:hypothetical protein
MNPDVQEIKEEVNLMLQELSNDIQPDEVLTTLYDYVVNKRLEFVEPQGDCV